MSCIRRYSTPLMQNTYRFALACGAVPLAAGIAFYLIWIATRLEILRTVGAAVIFISLLLILVGCVALGRFAWIALHSPSVPRAQAWRAIIIAATLLSANLPVIAGLVGKAVIK